MVDDHFLCGFIPSQVIYKAGAEVSILCSGDKDHKCQVGKDAKSMRAKTSASTKFEAVIT